MKAICGQGRLGSMIAGQLAGQGEHHLSLRLDPQRGLFAPAGELPVRLGVLLICIVPRHPPGGSGWLGLLDGLRRQCDTGELQVDHAILVSSTAVYDGYASGWMRASTPARPATLRSQGLAEAEATLHSLAASSIVVRLCGLIGGGYDRYDPYAFSLEQPRHAVAVETAADLIAESMHRSEAGRRVIQLTDGYIYFQGWRYPADPQVASLRELADSYRLLLPGSHTISG